MPFTQPQLHAALSYAMAEYDHPKVTQKFLKPIAVLVMDHLVGCLDAPAKPETFICMNSMKSKKKNKWRREVRDGLRHTAPYDPECLVDLNVMVGTEEPYTSIMTAESEGYAGHAQTLKGAHAADNDFMWDLYKLLAVPSPRRVFLTRCSSNYFDLLQEKTNELIQKYADLAGEAEIVAIQFPTANMRRDPARILHWLPNAHTNGPSVSEWTHP